MCIFQNFDDENVVQNLLKQSIPKNAAKKKKVKFTCEWCQIEKKSVVGFASHIKQCQLRPVIFFNSFILIYSKNIFGIRIK